MEYTSNVEELWGPVELSRWYEVPCVSGRVATELDAIEGRAAFYIVPSEKQQVSPIDIPIPCCAIHREEGVETPVIVIQAELGWNGEEESRLVGYRMPGGGNGVCMMHELEILDAPDGRFQT